MRTQVAILILLVTIIGVLAKDLYTAGNEVTNEELDFPVDGNTLNREILSVSDFDRKKPKGRKPKKTKNSWLVITGGEIYDRFVNSSEIVSYLGVCQNPMTIPSLIVEIYEGQSIWVDKTLVYCGGSTMRQDAAPECWSLKPGETSWSPFANMTSARALFSLTVINNGPDQLLAVGGLSKEGVYENCLDNMEIYNFANSKWKTLPWKFPNPICGQCAVRIGKKTMMIIGGGSTFHNSTDLVWKIDLSKKTKKYVKPLQVLPVPLWRPACIRREEFVYVSGGKLSNGSSSADVYKYNIKTNTWSPIGLMNTPRYGHGMGSTAAKQMVVAGGFDESSIDGYLSTIEDTYNNGVNWTVRSQTLKEAKADLAMAEVPAYLFNCD